MKIEAKAYRYAHQLLLTAITEVNKQMNFMLLLVEKGEISISLQMSAVI